MRRLTILTLAILLSWITSLAQRTSPPSKAELAQVTERGRELAEYDVAVWHSSGAVVAMKPVEGSVARYIGKKSGSVWTVMFGRLNDKRDKFLIAYEATQSASPKEFTVKRYETPREDTGFFLSAAKAIETTVADFKGASRPYNIVVDDIPEDKMYFTF